MYHIIENLTLNILNWVKIKFFLVITFIIKNHFYNNYILFKIIYKSDY